MKKISLSSLPIFILSITLLTACGGHGGTTPQPKAILTLSTAITGTIPAGTTINGYNVTITLPAGVTVRSAVNPPETDAGVVTATGTASGALVSGVFTAATGTFPGTVKIYVASATGFDAGEFCKVACDFAAGYSPMASDFVPLTLDYATGLDLASLSTATTLADELSLTATVAIK